MSEPITIGGNPETIYGTSAAGTAHMGTRLGARYRTWEGLEPDDQLRSFVSARDYIDGHSWIADYDTFAKRDALIDFQKASYELAALASEDEDVLTAVDQGSNIKSANAGGAGVEFFNPTDAFDGSASTLPQIVQQLVGKYLAGSSTGAGTPLGQSGSSVNPFSVCATDGRTRPF